MVKEMLDPIAVGLMLKVIPPRDDGVGVRAEHKKSPQGSICSPGGGFLTAYDGSEYAEDDANQEQDCANDHVFGVLLLGRQARHTTSLRYVLRT